MWFHYFEIISSWKRAGSFLWTNLNPLHPRMHWAKFGWNRTSGSTEDFFNFVNVISRFCNYLPLEKGGALHLNKLISPSPKDVLCQVWLKLAKWFWRRRFFYFVNVFLSPLGKERGPSFEQTWISFTQGCFVPSLVEIGLVVLEKWTGVVLEKKMKMWKVYRRTDGRTDRQTTDDRWSEKLTWALSSGELKSFLKRVSMVKKNQSLFLRCRIT